MNILFYDFETFKYDFLVVIIDYNTKEKTCIINDADKVKSFYELHKDDIWVGYNSRGYDQFILKGIIKGMNPAKINEEIIVNGKRGYDVIGNTEDIPLNNFDISTGFHGLKQLEGFMGSTIKESDVPFDIDRKLTKEEVEEVLKYCTHDVEQTIEVFENRREEFDSQLSLIEAFNLPMTMFNKTKAQLSAHILGSNKVESRNDEFDISIPDTIKISEKYKYILDWYLNTEIRDYRKSLETTVAGVPHTFAWGGVHGAVDNFSTEGLILCCDVASLYPSIMIEYGYISRNVSNPALYKEIRDTRLELKKKKDPRQAPYKIVLNGTYGAMKDKHNDLYDPLMANNVCVAGQLLLLDLIEKIEPYCELIQSNTDGIFVKVKCEEDIELIKTIAKEWERRTRLDLEWDLYSKIYQKDVNNYIIINQDGKYKSKGAYVKKLNNIDYDLPIVNKALINYFIKGISIEQTINQCDDLREFQKIVKVSSLYKYALHGEVKLKEKVLRVFASNNENACGVYKVKTEDRIEKIANTPEKCFIYNDTVINVKVPEELDKQYYIDVAQKRLSDFLDAKTTKKSNKMPSDIKYINQEVKDEVLQLYEKDYITFVDFLVKLIEDSLANARQIEILAKLNYFIKFGRNRKLIDICEEFFRGKNKYNKNLKQETKQKRLEILYDLERTIENQIVPVSEQIKYEIEMMGTPKSTYNLREGTSYILEVISKKNCSPKLKVYGLTTGNIIDLKISTKDFNFKKIQEGDIVRFDEIISKSKSKFVGNDENGKAMFEPIEGEKEFWGKSYEILKRSDNNA